MARSAGLMVALVLAGCSEEGAWVGTYAVDSSWKLSGPLANGRTVGDAASELFIDKLVSFVPAPSFVEDKLDSWLTSSIGSKIKTAVDTNVPKELAPGGKWTLLLGQALVAVSMESTLRLEGEAEGDMEGTETFTAVKYVIGGKPRRIAASTLCGCTETGISAPWGGEEPEEGKLSVDQHTVSIRYGELVRLILADLVPAAELATLKTQMTQALGCKAIVAAILGGGTGLKISVAGWDHTVSDKDLESLCSSAMALVEKKAMGQFELDTHVQVGGTVLWTRVQESGSIKLQSGPGFGGIVNVVPDAVAPRVDVTFTGLRKQDG